MTPLRTVSSCLLSAVLMALERNNSSEAVSCSVNLRQRHPQQAPWTKKVLSQGGCAHRELPGWKGAVVGPVAGGSSLLQSHLKAARLRAWLLPRSSFSISIPKSS